jgi:hypothetical protein
MTTANRRHEPLFDIHPVTGASIEIFYADNGLTTFGPGRCRLVLAPEAKRCRA